MAANRRFTSQFSYSFERQCVRLMGAMVQTGSAGSATFAPVTGTAPFTMARISAGLYEITIPDTYSALIGANIVVQKTTAADITPQMVSSSVSSTGKLRFRTNAAGVATDLIATDVVYIDLALRNNPQ